MEGVDSINIHCVLDACTVINLIHIDQNDFVYKSLNRLQLYIAEKVFSEVKRNVRNKYFNYSFESSEEKYNVLKEIDMKVAKFRKFIYHDKRIKNEIGDQNFFNDIQNNTNYKKFNGEFYSTALSIFLSRYNEIKIIFHTDDYPARDYFSDYFLYQQIGHIEDTVDLILLIYIYSDSEKFSKKTLMRLLSDLFQEYATSVKKFEKALEKFKNNIPERKLSQKHKLRNNLTLLLKKIRELSFTGINDLKKQLIELKYPRLNTLLNKYLVVFELETNLNTNILRKIEKTMEKLNADEIYKVY